jgi:hypothetical protein
MIDKIIKDLRKQADKLREEFTRIERAIEHLSGSTTKRRGPSKMSAAAGAKIAAAQRARWAKWKAAKK